MVPHHTAIPRACLASSSRLLTPARHSNRRFSVIPNRSPDILPFFTPQFGSPLPFFPQSGGVMGKSEGKDTAPPKWKGEEEVDDREWEIRVGESGQ